MRAVDADGLRSIVLKTNAISPTAGDIIDRLSQMQPREVLPQGELPAPEQGGFNRDKTFALYCGSGVSYGSGLPTLNDIHEMFDVDSMRAGSFVFSPDDRLPSRLACDVDAFFVEAASFYIACANATPTRVHRAIRKLQDQRDELCVFTDNIDLLFEKSGVRSTNVRTVFPHSSGVPLPDVETLLVVGVAADRRGIIGKARARGMSIVVVNPMAAVSPRAQNLSYIKASDKWFRMTATEFFVSNFPNEAVDD